MSAVSWMWRIGLGLLGCGMGLLAGPAAAESVRERAISIRVDAAGVLHETTRLVVHMSHADDLAAWGAYRLYLDTNRELISIQVEVTTADGAVRVLGEAAVEERDATGRGVLHGSQRVLSVALAPLAVGDTVAISHRIRFAPYFPASHVNVRGSGAIDRLHVAVTSETGPLRWHLTGVRDDLMVTETQEGVTVAASDLPGLARHDHLPRDAGRARLAFAWGELATWSDVGRWYRQAIDDLPPSEASVGALARELVADGTPPAAAVERLVRFLEEKVRYVAVTVGEGNILPTPAATTLARGWGDCKDKTLLLVDLLAAVGVPAFPALVRLDAVGRVDPAFPALSGFNHAIAAVPIAALGEPPLGPVNDGFLFIDTTQQRAAGAWLVPGLQGQKALVIEPDGGRLVTTPLLTDQEVRRLEVDLSIDAAGDARGSLRLYLRGGPAYAALGWLETLSAADAEVEARALVASMLPGVEVDAVSITPAADRTPTVDLGADIAWPGWARPSRGATWSMHVPGMRATPDPASLAERTVDAVVPSIRTEARWRLGLPGDAACRATTPDVRVEHEVARFVQHIVAESPATLVLARHAEIGRRFVSEAALAELEAVALAEHRAHRRRIRLDCQVP